MEERKADKNILATLCSDKNIHPRFFIFPLKYADFHKKIQGILKKIKYSTGEKVRHFLLPVTL